MKMNKNIVTLLMLSTSAVILGIGTAAQAEIGQNAVGPSLGISDGKAYFGVDSKFVIKETLSVRPFIYFPSSGAIFGAGLTYDFIVPNPVKQSQATPFVGGAVAVASGSNSTTAVYITGGADFDITDNIQFKGALAVPLTGGQTTQATFTAGYRF
jgi:hypothetical protein